MKKNVLVLYTNYGTGHYMAAKAIEELIYSKYKNCNVLVMDPLTYSRPLINKIFAKIGKIVATKFRRFRGKLYKKKMYKNYLKNSWFFMFCTKLFWTKKLEKKLLDFNPDLIISTQVGPTGLIAAHKDMFNAKLVGVFTDYGLHRMYTVAHEFIDIFCVPNKEIKDMMIELGINKNKIKLTGIPVRLAFTMDGKIKKRNKPHYLFICGGGLGYDNAFCYFEKLLESNIEFTYTFIAGKNDSLVDKAIIVAANYDKQGEILGYVNNIDEYIRNSDLVFGKPGGILTSETLNLGVPLCAIEPIPGQETNNSMYIDNNNFGFYIKNLKEFNEFLCKLKKKKIKLDDYSKNIKNYFVKFKFIDINKI